MKRRVLFSSGIRALALAGLAPLAARAQMVRGRAPQALRSMVVEAVQMPAWSTEGGLRRPLAPGDTVSTAQEVQTDAGAALVLRLPEGSLIRLGEKTRLGVQRLEVGDADGRTAVRSEMTLFDGFFRFATSAVAKAVGQRQINVTLRTATIGIRGTDFWSMTDAVHDAACIFEGRIDLDTRDQGALVLDKPTAFWARFFQQPVQPVGNATPQQLVTFLGSTELSPGKGVALAGGRWQVLALGTRDSREALRVAGRLRAAGYPAQSLAVGGSHEVRIAGLATREDAQAVLARIAAVEGVDGRVVSSV